MLYDALPTGIFIGGAVFNVACHLHALNQSVRMVSCVGDDVLGHEVIRRMQMRSMDTSLVQMDPELPTGWVEINLDASGIPEYTIRAPAAWDNIALTGELSNAVDESAAVVFGTLAQRNAVSRRTIQAVEKCTGLKVCDLNFRAPFIDQTIVERSLHIADVVKLNDDELDLLRSWWALPQHPQDAIAALADTFKLQAVCMTRGQKGAALWQRGSWHVHPGFAVEVADTVGSGDAFLAGLLQQLLSGADSLRALVWANRMGAWVASQQGATPPLQFELMAALKEQSVAGP